MENSLPIANVDLAAPTATSPKLRGGVEHQAIEQYITESGRFLEAARISSAINERLADYGFDDDGLSFGMALQDAALKAYGASHSDNLPDRGGNADELKAKIDHARDEFDGYRLVARAVFPALNDRINLRVMGDVPDDLQRFVNTAHAGYTAASEEPYTDKLTKRGYPAARLASMNEFLDALAFLDAAHDAAAEAAQAGEPDSADGEPAGSEKAERDAAYVELKAFMKEIKGVARAAFRKEPELLAQLGL